MDQHPNEVLKKANDFLKQLLDQSSSRGTEAIAQSITSLAYEEGNPVRNLFVTALPHAQSPNPAPSIPGPTHTTAPRTLKARSSVKFLRLARRDNKIGSAEAKASLPDSQADSQRPTTAGSGNIALREARENAAQSSLSVDSENAPSAEASSVAFNCVICKDDMSSKGVCKRHLDEQHVSPKVFRCERCGEDFPTKADAKKHCNRCGLGVFTYTVVKTQAKKIYASEFSEEWFASKSTYLEHLLKMSKKGVTRPEPSQHCKLRALLGHPSLRPLVDKISKTLYGSPTAWQNICWNEDALERAIHELESAAMVHENGTIDFADNLIGEQHCSDVRTFLRNLLCTNISQTTNHHRSASVDIKTERSNIVSGQTYAPTTIPEQPSPLFVDNSGIHQDTSEQADRMSISGSPRSVTMAVPDDLPSTLHDAVIQRHLSNASQVYQPPQPGVEAQTAPIQFRLPFNALEDGGNTQQFPISNSVTSPDRSQQGSVGSYQTAPCDMFQIHPRESMAASLTTQPSAAASQSTLVSNYQEPKFIDTTPSDYNYWSLQQNINFAPTFNDPNMIPYLDYSIPSDASLRTPSIATTDRTYIGVPEEDSKLENFLPLTSYPAATFAPYIVDNNLQNQFNGMHQ